MPQVRYSAQDVSGNAESAVRWVHVMCPASETLCERGAGGTGPERYCSTEQICMYLNLPQPRAVATVLTTLTLLGPTELVIYQGDPYSMCPWPRPLQSVCDQGAKANHPDEGDVSRYIAVCQAGARMPQYGVSACNITTSIPGARFNLVGPRD